MRETDSFFNLYWKNEYGQRPIWASKEWTYNGSIPNNDKRGCYALFTNDNIIYIGVGIGKSFGQYHGSGLGDRLKEYWKVNKSSTGNQYIPTDNWKEVTGILTIGFDENHYPLAAALEVFLIRELSPAKNTQHK